MFSRPNADPPIIQLDEASAAPKYQQIADQVRALVASRRLLPGAALPSVRQLASDLGININTVLAAYRALEADGVVLLRRGSRAVIHPRLAKATLPAPADLARISALLERVRTDALLAGLTPQQLHALAEQIFAADPPVGVSSNLEEG
jgi:DNA-binding transcriptional regulator YhcF (GntR family)